MRWWWSCPKGTAWQKKFLLASDLKGEPLVVGTESSWSVYRRLIFSEFHRLNVPPLISQEAPTPSAIIALVKAGLGLTIFPKSYSDNFAQSLVRCPLVGEQSAMNVICAWNRADINPALQAMLQYLPDVQPR
ncbi:LysR substrate-binding domain-containing protein [Bosea vestrisii]|uniref:LysR substrate-binding domain-containing protein n=1 Tax=Bosea vestrisii TaxID=151416 RepID=A0ABW0HCX7_9HYPH